MSFRLKAFGLHFSGSLLVLTLVLGTLYAGWYRWPGWYLTGAAHVAVIMVLVDAALGPLITLLIASPRKPRRELARDVAIIVAVQACALVYGAGTLWHGRPIYYAFSVSELDLVQASDLDAHETELARRQNPRFAPVWYLPPRWVWAPLPDDKEERARIVVSAPFGGKDVVQMPRYFRPWELGAGEMRKHLRQVDHMILFTRAERACLKERMKSLGFSPDQASSMIMTGRGRPLLAVFDPTTLRLKAILRAN